MKLKSIFEFSVNVNYELNRLNIKKTNFNIPIGDLYKWQSNKIILSLVPSILVIKMLLIGDFYDWQSITVNLRHSNIINHD